MLANDTANMHEVLKSHIVVIPYVKDSHMEENYQNIKSISQIGYQGHPPHSQKQVLPKHHGGRFPTIHPIRNLKILKGHLCFQFGLLKKMVLILSMALYG